MDSPRAFHKPVRYNIAKLVRKLRRKSPVRRWLESNEEIEAGSADSLFRALARTDIDGWRDRAVAFHALGLIELSPLEREHAGRLLLDAFKKPDVIRLSLGGIGRVAFLAFVGWLTFAILFSMSLGALPSLIFLSLVTVPFVLVVQEQNRTAITKWITATALAQVGGPECIVALWKDVQRNSPISDEAFAALKAILPRMSADLYGQLPAGCNDALVEMARSPDLPDLAIAALDALERAGDGRCAKGIARITPRNAAGRVYKRAVAILPTLIARHEREQAAATLLRPSASVSAENLVRPVYGSAPDVTNLLRASQTQSAATPHDPSAP